MRFWLKLFVASGLIALTIVLVVNQHPRATTRQLQINYLDIGQGDASLITTADKQNILIDGGPDQQILNALSRHLAWWNRRLDIIIISHDHADHWGGLAYILKKYQISQIVLAQPPKISVELTAILTEAKQQGVKIVDIRAPAVIQLADGSQVKILWPTDQQLQEQAANINNQSIVLLWQYGQNKFLWTGDLETEAENELLASQQPNHPADIIKIAHHGSWTATGLAWLNYWRPSWAVISVGANNQFNLPTQLTLDRLQRFNIKLWRTDQQGDLRIYSDGQTIWHKTD